MRPLFLNRQKNYFILEREREKKLKLKSNKIIIKSRIKNYKKKKKWKRVNDQDGVKERKWERVREIL